MARARARERGAERNNLSVDVGPVGSNAVADLAAKSTRPGDLLRELVASLKIERDAARPEANLPDLDHPDGLRPRRDGPRG